MPKLNRFRILNIGVSKKIHFDDITLDFRGGSHTLVIAPNGGGKSTTIGFMLALLKPRHNDFIRGDGKKKRTLKDYVFKDSPAHIVAEWINNENGNITFLVTGCIMTWENNNLRKFFYSFIYPRVLINPNDLTFDSLKFFTPNDELYSGKEFEQYIKKSKSDFKHLQIYETEKISSWEKNLDFFKIDSNLVQILLTMNQQEGDMAEYLNFEQNSDFIKFLVESIRDLRDNALFSEYKDCFGELKDIPKKIEEQKIITTLISLFEKNLHLSEKSTNLFSQTNILKMDWETLMQLGNDSLEYLIIKDNEIKDSIKLHEDNINNYTKLQKQAELKTQSLIYIKDKLELNQLEQKRNEAESKYNYLAEIKKYCDLLYPIWEKEELDRKYTTLSQDFSKDEKPFLEDLELKRRILISTNDQMIKIEAKNLETKSNLLKRTKQQSNQKQTERNNTQVEIRSIQRDIPKIKKEIAEIENQIQPLLVQINQKKDPATIISEIDLHIEDTSREIHSFENNEALKKEEKLQIESKIRQNQKENTTKDTLLQNKINSLEKLKSKILDFYSNPIIQSVLGLESEEFGEFKEHFFEYMTEANKKELEKRTTQQNEKIFKINAQIQELEFKINYFIDNSFQYPGKEIEDLIEFINQNSKKDIAYGWDYLRTKFLDINIRDQIITQIPLILDGIVINATPEEIKEIYSKWCLSSNYKTMERTIPVVSSSIFEEIYQNQTNLMDVGKFGIYFKPDLEWKYNDEQEKKKFNDQNIQKKDLLIELTRLKENIQFYNEAIEKWKIIQSEYSKSHYSILFEDIQKLNGELQELKEEENANQIAISNLMQKLENISKSISDLKEKNENFRLDKQRMNYMISQYRMNTQKYALIQELEKKDSELNIDFQKISDEIELLEKNIKEYEKERTNIEKTILDYQDIETKYSTCLIDLPKEKIENITPIKKSSFPIYIEEINNLYLIYETKIKKSDKKGQIEEVTRALTKIKTKISRKVRENGLDQNSPILVDLKAKIKTESDLDIYIEKINEEKEVIYSEKQGSEKDIKKINLNLLKIEDQLQGTLNEHLEFYQEIRLDNNAIEEQISHNKQDIEHAIKEMNNSNNQLQNLKENKSEIEKKSSEIKPKFEMINTYLANIENVLNNLIKNYGILAEIRQNTNGKIFDAELIQTFIPKYDELFIQNKQMSELYEGLENNSESFIHKIKSIVIPEILQTAKIQQFISTFSKDQIVLLMEKHSHLEVYLKQIEEQLKEPEKRFNNIIERYNIEIKEIMTSIRKIQNVKTPIIEEMPQLSEKNIIKISWKKYTDEEIKRIIKDYFEKFEINHSIWPDLTTEAQIIQGIIAQIVEQFLIKVEIIFPDQEMISYQTISEMVKNSGGETVTLAILLFCLIAHFKMKNKAEPNTHPTISFPLIMDNPFGKANRNDFNMLQIKLSENLNIQMISFGFVNDVELAHSYPNQIIFNKVRTSNGEKLIELDENSELINIQESAIAIKPVIRIKQPTILDFSK